MVLSMDRWMGKVAIVTGASSGIGAAIADALVENGLIVVGVARRSNLVQQRSKELSDKKGKLHAYQADVACEEEVLELFRWTTKNLGPVHILVNNAGRRTNESNLTSGETELWKSVFNVNVLAVCVATREAVKIMKENKINGHIIHMNSILGHVVVGVPNLSVYPATKHAITALTETLRHEFNHLGLKIKITSVSPGFVESEMTILSKNLSQQKRVLLEKWPILKPQDIADGVIYALSTPEHVQVVELTIKPVGEIF